MGAGDDAELIALCAEYDEAYRQSEAVFESEPDDDVAEASAAKFVAQQVELSRRIKSSRVCSAEGIFAIARSLAIHNATGTFDFDPNAGGITSNLMTALLRESLLLSGLPVPSTLEGRA